MFDIAWTEMLFLVLLTVLVVGPKDLPRVMRGVGSFIRKMRNMAGEFMDGVDEMARENDLEDVTKQIKNVKSGNMAGFIGDAIDPDGELGGMVNDITNPTETAEEPAAVKEEAKPKKKAAAKKTTAKKATAKKTTAAKKKTPKKAAPKKAKTAQPKATKSKAAKKGTAARK